MDANEFLLDVNTDFVFNGDDLFISDKEVEKYYELLDTKNILLKFASLLDYKKEDLALEWATKIEHYHVEDLYTSLKHLWNYIVYCNGRVPYKMPETAAYEAVMKKGKSNDADFKVRYLVNNETHLLYAVRLTLAKHAVCIRANAYVLAQSILNQTFETEETELIISKIYNVIKVLALTVNI